jgi:tetratricopeptide (TPR) repeat protein
MLREAGAGIALMALAGAAVCAEPMKSYQDAKRLMKAMEFRQAKTVLEAALKESRETQDFYFAFYFARDLARCEEADGHILSSIGYAEEALDLLDKAGERMPEATRVHERLLLEGAVSARYLDRHQISLARQWQRRTNRTLLAHIEKRTGQPYDLKSGTLPRGLDTSTGIRIVRQLWHESRILEHEARTTEALACLEAAERLLTARPDIRRDGVAEDYYWKVQNMRATLLDFLGFLPEAIAIDRLCAEREVTTEHEHGIQIARLNLNRNLSQYHGPSEGYLKDALAACARIEAVGNPASGKGARRVLNKMIFDLTQDPAATQQLAAVEAALKASGRQMEAEYTERDRLMIAVQTGTGEKRETEAGLQRLLETFRNNGNRSGEVSLFRTYADFCFKEGRYDDALYLYTRCCELTKQYGWHVHLPRIMERLARVRLRLGDPAGAERWLREIQATLAAHPDFPAYRRAESMALMADLLAALGREGEGQAVRAQAAAYAESNRVPDFWRRKFAAGEKREAAEKAAETAGASPKTDLQPRRVISETLPGETALARLTLANPAGGARAGKLLYPASAKLLRRDDAAGEIHLELCGGGGAAAELPLELAASGLVHVFLEAEVAEAGTDETAEIRWLPQGGKPQTAEWRYRATEERAGITVVNANLAELNPFYYVPLYHAIRKRDAAARVFDFSVVCSAPCHVEIVDVTSGEVMAVDRQGDGSFDGEGDFAFQDSNGNLFPDHAFAGGETLFGIEIRVYPAGGADAAKTGDIAVTVMGASGGQWQELSENILKKNKAN